MYSYYDKIHDREIFFFKSGLLDIEKIQQKAKNPDLGLNSAGFEPLLCHFLVLESGKLLNSSELQLPSL